MSRTEKYTPCLSLCISHGYYTAQTPARFVPDRRAIAFFRQAGWIFRDYSLNHWWLLRPEGERMQPLLDALREENMRLSFQIVPLERSFLYVTDRAETEGIPGEIVPAGVRQLGIWATLTVDLHRIAEEIPTVTVRLHPPEKRLEFILIPRHTNADAVVRLEEVQGKLDFSPPEKTTFLNQGEVYRITTTQKVRLQEHPDFRFRLWEVRDSGERLLADWIPYPQPDELSVYDPKECVTTYFYY